LALGGLPAAQKHRRPRGGGDTPAGRVRQNHASRWGIPPDLLEACKAVNASLERDGVGEIRQNMIPFVCSEDLYGFGKILARLLK
jgi:hypothetical protein